jgi:hypothetical protein
MLFFLHLCDVSRHPSCPAELGQPCVRRPDEILTGRRSLISRRIFPATPV